MNASPRNIVAVVLGLLFLFVGVFLVDRMVVHRRTIAAKRYTDHELLTMMNRLIATGVIYNCGGKVAVDYSRLRGKERDRVPALLASFYVGKSDRRIHFDSNAISVTNTRTDSTDPLLRGRFLDRRGMVLAETTVNERTWKTRRNYNYGPELFSVIGHKSRIFGKRHLEKELDEYLGGRLHAQVYRKTNDPFKKVILGDDVVLTLDLAVQKRAFELLGRLRGAVVVLDVRTGEIIAAASTPAFSPNNADHLDWERASMDLDARPFENKAFATLYPPGSTFKTVVAAAWLEQKDVSAKPVSVVCTGRKNSFGISCPHPHGVLSTLEDAFSVSCNQYFSEAGVELGSALEDYSLAFGFNRSWNLIEGVTRAGEGFTAVASPAFQNKEGGLLSSLFMRRNPRLIAQGSFGQNLVMATPLQMAMVAATVANNGVLNFPTIVRSISSAEGQVIYSQPNKQGQRVIKLTTAARLKELMLSVMRNGTGKSIKKLCILNGKCSKALSGTVSVAGKTGTAETGDGKEPHSWFIGFAPAERPRFAVAVVAEHQGYGSLTAAPIATEVLAEALSINLSE